MTAPFSLYLHIPYCFQKCPYCDFNTYAVAEIPEKEYVAALLSELDYRATLTEWKGRTVQSIFFGGGTPSLFSPFSIRKIIASICQTFPVDEHVEISLEANPGTLDHDSLRGLKDAGVNRLSLGAQSFNPDTLKTLGRMHTANQIEAAILGAKSVGINNISVDLMYGVPGQKLVDFEADVIEALRLAPQHISAYGLTIEKSTPFYRSFKKGTLKLPPESTVIKMMESVNNALPERGLERYEISNFARPGFEAKHNLAYWNGSDYMGLGAGAHSYYALTPDPTAEVAWYGRRWCNFGLPSKYIQEAVSLGKAESWHEELGFKEAIFEFFFLGLRKIRGVDLRNFTLRFGHNAEEFYGSLLKVLKEKRLIKRKDDLLSLSDKGLLLADSVIENFAEPVMLDHEARKNMAATPPSNQNVSNE